jgi:hypothetical protein
VQQPFVLTYHEYEALIREFANPSQILNIRITTCSAFTAAARTLRRRQRRYNELRGPTSGRRTIADLRAELRIWRDPANVVGCHARPSGYLLRFTLAYVYTIGQAGPAGDLPNR